MRNRKTIEITRKECSDTGLIMVLISLVAGLFFKHRVFDLAAMVLAIVTIALPQLLYPLAVLWFGLARILGIVTSNIFLAIIFFVIVTPVALIRKITGKDRLMLGKFKKDRDSAYTIRSHIYKADDLAHPY